MKLIWGVSRNDIEKVREFYETQKDRSLVRQRLNTNVKGAIPKLTKSSFWQTMVMCLLTTQQRSGPQSKVSQFCLAKPFPLSYALCQADIQLQMSVQAIITNFGGIRRAKTISEEVCSNFKWLENGGWNQVFSSLEDLQKNQSQQMERQVAEFIDDNLRGFGPKQSRNLLQALGLTKYEIPIDSRITKWLNSFGFPLKLSATTLADRNYYNMVSDGFQRLCEEAGIYPCLLDAAIFSSFDEEEWPSNEA
jgi:thermostable 8-oxoguanine DNA glycosylase